MDSFRVKLFFIFLGLLALYPVFNVRATTIYFIREDINSLHTFDTTTNAIAPVGPLGIAFQFGGMDYDPINDILYMIDGRGPRGLYRINRSTGAATLIGIHGIVDLFGLAYDTANQILYATQFSGGSGLYRMNINTGAATFIGTMPNQCGALAYDILRDRLIGYQEGAGNVWNINRANGAQTFIRNIGGINDAGLAYDYANDRFWAFDWSNRIFFAAGDFSSSGLVTTTSFPMDGAAALNVLCTLANYATSFGGGNNQNGNMFDLLNLQPYPLIIRGFDVNLVAPGVAGSIQIYIKAGSYSGFENSAGSWTLQYSVTDNFAAGVVNIPLPPSNYFIIPPFSTVGVYITRTDIGSYLSYTDGVYDANDGRLRLQSGLGVAYAFGGTFSPRTWNGRVYYSYGMYKLFLTHYFNH